MVQTHLRYLQRQIGGLLRSTLRFRLSGLDKHHCDLLAKIHSLLADYIRFSLSTEVSSQSHRNSSRYQLCETSIYHDLCVSQS